MPLHVPSLQTYGQVVLARQFPFSSQIWIVAPMQRVSFTAHWVHAPISQADGQVFSSCHLPIASHALSLSPTHCFAPGAHSPTHAASAQAFLQAVPSTHWPLALQVRGVWPSQPLVPAAHSVQAPSVHAPAHVVFLVQAFPSVHSRTSAPVSLHLVAPGGHASRVCGSLPRMALQPKPTTASVTATAKVRNARRITTPLSGSGSPERHRSRASSVCGRRSVSDRVGAFWCSIGRRLSLRALRRGRCRSSRLCSRGARCSRRRGRPGSDSQRRGTPSGLRRASRSRALRRRRRPRGRRPRPRR